MPIITVARPIYQPQGVPSYTADDDVGTTIQNNTSAKTPFLNVYFYVRQYTGGTKTTVGATGGTILGGLSRPFSANWSDSGPYYSGGSSFVLGADVYYSGGPTSAPEANCIVV